MSDLSHKSGADSSTPKKATPFSIRLTEDERERLVAAASGIPLGSYIKATMLGYAPPIRRRASPLPKQDKRILAKALALFARSRVANNLNQLARAANIGTLPVTLETDAELKETLRVIRRLHDLMMDGLGYRMEDRF
jgi:nitroreductase